MVQIEAIYDLLGDGYTSQGGSDHLGKTQKLGPRITPNDEEMNHLALGHSKNFSTFEARAAYDVAQEIPAGLWQ
jgi:hypothetical protein